MPFFLKNEASLSHITSERSLRTGQSVSDVAVIDLTSDSEPEGACLSAWQTQKAKLFMIQHMSSGVMVSAVAQACHLSRSHFSRAFRNSTGRSPRDWIRRAQLIRAADLLVKTDQAISQVALECGFADQSHFTRVFAKTLGISPGKWRALRKSSPKDNCLLPQFVGEL